MSVVVAPPFFNFATPLLHDAKNLRYFAARNPVILRHLNARLKPHFDLALGGIDVDVHAILKTASTLQGTGSRGGAEVAEVGLGFLRVPRVSA